MCKTTKSYIFGTYLILIYSTAFIITPPLPYLSGKSLWLSWMAPLESLLSLLYQAFGIKLSVQEDHHLGCGLFQSSHVTNKNKGRGSLFYSFGKKREAQEKETNWNKLEVQLLCLDVQNLRQIGQVTDRTWNAF